MTDYVTIKVPELTLKQLSELSGDEDVMIVQNGVYYRTKSSSFINDVEANLTSTSDTKQLAASQGKVLNDKGDWQNSADGLIFAYSDRWTLTLSGTNMGVVIPSCEISEINSTTPTSTSATAGTIVDNGGLVLTKSGSTFIYSFVADLSTITEGSDLNKWVIVKNIDGVLYTRIPSIASAIAGGSSTFDYIDFTSQVTPPVYKKGRLYYDDTKNALTYFNDSSEVAVNLGQEIYFLIENQTGSTLSNGTVISPDETTVITKANAYEKHKSRVIAVLTEDVADGETGYATKLGQVGGLDTSSFSAGQIVYLGNDGDFVSATPTDGGYICIVGVVDNVSATEGIITVDTKTSDTTVEVTDTNGFPPDQRTGTTISFVDGTRAFTIAPTGTEFHFYELGDKYSKTSSENIVIADTTGTHIIYYDMGVLSNLVNGTESEIEDIILNKCIVAYIYWNSTTAKAEIVQDERHGLMQPVVHVYLHQRFGAFYLSGLALSDFVIGDGSLNSHAQFSIASGVIKDEDMAHPLNAIASTTGLKYYYRSGSNGDYVSDTNTGYSFPVGSTPLPQYNEFTGSTWKLTEVASGDYMNLHLFANGAIDGDPIVFVGTAEYASVASASSGQADELTTILANLPLPEFVLIGSVILRGRTQFGNDVQTAIYQNTEGENYTNWTTTELAAGAAPTNHNNLAGLEAAGSGVTWGHVDETQHQSYLTEVIQLACSDETTALTSGTAKITFRMPFAMTLTDVRASLTGAGSTSGTTTVDINESGTTVLSTKLTIDFGEKTSETAAAPAVISDSALADDSEITIDIDAVTGGADETGLKVSLIGTRS